RTQAAQAEFNEPIATASTTVETPAQPSSQAPREGSPVALPQQRVVQASDPAPAIPKKSPAPAPVKRTSTPSRTSTNLARAPSAKAPTAWYAAQNRSSTQARRAHASWASLQPPAWLRGGPGPGAPPGAKTREPHAALVASPLDAA